MRIHNCISHEKCVITIFNTINKCHMTSPFPLFLDSEMHAEPPTPCSDSGGKFVVVEGKCRNEGGDIGRRRRS